MGTDSLFLTIYFSEYAYRLWGLIDVWIRLEAVGLQSMGKDKFIERLDRSWHTVFLHCPPRTPGLGFRHIVRPQPP